MGLLISHYTYSNKTFYLHSNQGEKFNNRCSVCSFDFFLYLLAFLLSSSAFSGLYNVHTDDVSSQGSHRLKLNGLGGESLQTVFNSRFRSSFLCLLFWRASDCWLLFNRHGQPCHTKKMIFYHFNVSNIISFGLPMPPLTFFLTMFSCCSLPIKLPKNYVIKLLFSVNDQGTMFSYCSPCPIYSLPLLFLINCLMVIALS